MAKAERHPVTPAVRTLRAAGVAFTPHQYAYVDKGGTAASAAATGWDEHAVIKTLVFLLDGREGVVVLMHGDREVSARALARALGAREAVPAPPAEAERRTGYQVGGISPFGQRTPMPIVVEPSVLSLPAVLVNGGKRGFLVALAPRVFVDVLRARPLAVAQPT